MIIMRGARNITGPRKCFRYFWAMELHADGVREHKSQERRERVVFDIGRWVK